MVSGGNLNLVSNGIISGDAHYQAGGNVSFLNLDGKPGQFVSLFDPIIISDGDVILGDYTGPTLWIEAAGKISTGHITINAIDPAISAEPLLSLKAGITTPSAGVNLAQGTTQNQSGTTINSSTPTTPATLQTGNIVIDANGIGGPVILEAPGNIQTGSITSNGGAIYANSQQGNITTTAVLNSTSASTNSGNIALQAQGDITTTGLNSSSSNLNNSGSITLYSMGGKIDTSGGETNTSSVNGNSGEILFYADQNSITTGNINTANSFGNSGGITLYAGSDVTTNNINTNNANILLRSNNGSINTTSGNISGGSINLEAYNDIFTGQLNSNGNNILLTTHLGNIDTTRGNIESGTNVNTGGEINLTAGADIFTGNIFSYGGNIELKSYGWNGIDTTAGTIDSSSPFGGGGNIINLSNGGIITRDIISGGGEISFDSGFIDTRNGTINSSSTTGNGGAINLSANSRIKTGTVISGGGNINLYSSSFEIDTSGGEINSSSALSGGDIYIRGVTDLTTGNVISNGGKINLSVVTGTVNTNAGVLNSTSSNAVGGDISLEGGNLQSGEITTGGGNITARFFLLIDTSQGNINSSYSRGNGGNIILGRIPNVGNYESPFPEITTGNITTGGGEINFEGGGINTTGGDLNSAGLTNGGNVRISGRDLLTGNIISGGGSIHLLGRGQEWIGVGDIDTSAGILNSASTIGTGGNITLEAYQNTKTREIISGGGNISITSSTGEINSLGNLNSYLTGVNGGDIKFYGATNVTVNGINSGGGNVEALSAEGKIDSSTSAINSTSETGIDGSVTLSAKTTISTGTITSGAGQITLTTPSGDGSIVAGFLDSSAVVVMDTASLPPLAPPLPTEAPLPSDVLTQAPLGESVLLLPETPNFVVLTPPSISVPAIKSASNVPDGSNSTEYPNFIGVGDSVPEVAEPPVEIIMPPPDLVNSENVAQAPAPVTPTPASVTPPPTPVAQTPIAQTPVAQTPVAQIPVLTPEIPVAQTPGSFLNASAPVIPSTAQIPLPTRQTPASIAQTSIPQTPVSISIPAGGEAQSGVATALRTPASGTTTAQPSQGPVATQANVAENSNPTLISQSLPTQTENPANIQPISRNVPGTLSPQPAPTVSTQVPQPTIPQQTASQNQELIALAEDAADCLASENSENTETVTAVKNSQKSIECFEKNLEFARAAGDRNRQNIALHNLGVAYYALGNYDKAIEYQQQRLAFASSVADSQAKAEVLAQLGASYGAIGNYEKAVQFYEQSLEITRSLRVPELEASTLNNLGLVYFAQKNYSKAIKLQEQSLALARQQKNQQIERQAILNLGLAFYGETKYDQAIEYQQQGLNLAQQLKDVVGEQRSLDNLGLIYFAKQDYQKAIELHRQSLALARQTNDRQAEGRALKNLGDALYKAGNSKEAIQNLLASTEIWESLRGNLQNNLNKVSIFETQETTYSSLQEVLVKDNQLNAALEITERGRARAFVELLAKGMSNEVTQSNITPPNIEQIKEIAKTQNSTIVSYSIMQQVSDDEGERKLEESELYIWVVKPSGEVLFRTVDLSQKQNSITESVLMMRQFLGVAGNNRSVTSETRGNTKNKQLQNLYQVLIEPIKDLLPKNAEERVTFIPHESLFLVPFGALQNQEGKYLIEEHTILTAPSIQVLELTNEKRQQVRGKEVLVIGNPVMPSIEFVPGFPRQQLQPLPSAEVEAKEIARMFNTTALTGAVATKQEVLGKISAARIIHLATHGLLDDLDGMGLPGAIALAPGSGDEGLLTSNEIMGLKLNAELVVLSACDTGRGKITSDGVIGLSRSFLSAGTPSVVVSLWAVPDNSTADLMKEFYRELQQNSDKAKALRGAMLRMIDKNLPPRDWAAFTLVGEAE